MILVVAAIVGLSAQVIAQPYIPAECPRNGTTYPEGTEYATGEGAGTVRSRWEATEESRVDWRTDALNKRIPSEGELNVTETAHPKLIRTRYFYEIRVSKPSGDRCQVVGNQIVMYPSQQCLNQRDAQVAERNRLREIEAREKRACDNAIVEWRQDLAEYQRNPPRRPTQPSCIFGEQSRLRAIESEKAVCNTQIAAWRQKVATFEEDRPACIASEGQRNADIARLNAECNTKIQAWRDKLATNPNPRPVAPACMSSESPELAAKKQEKANCDAAKQVFINKYGEYGSGNLPGRPKAPTCMGTKSANQERLENEQASCESDKETYNRELRAFENHPYRNGPPRAPACMNNPYPKNSENVYVQHCPDVQHVVPRYDWISYQEATNKYSAGTQEDLVENRPIQVVIKAKGQVLRPHEEDYVSLRVNENAEIVNVGATETRNHYQISTKTINTRTAEVSVVGQGRKLGENGVKPTLSELFLNRPQVLTNGRQIWVQMDFNPEFMKVALDPGMKLKVTYEVLQTDGLHSSHTTFRRGQAETGVFDLSQTHHVRMNLSGAGRGRRVQAKIYVNIVGSKWYTEDTIITESDAATIR